jgi:hypothetical protein
MLKLSGEGMHHVTSFGLRPSDVKDNFLKSVKTTSLPTQDDAQQIRENPRTNGFGGPQS